MKKAQTSAGFAQIILILVVIALVGGAYYFGTLKPKQNVVIETPTEKPITSAVEPTSDTVVIWKTYIDTDWGYSINYPSTYTFVPKKDSATYIIISKPGGEVFGTEAFSHFKIVIEKSSFISVNEAIKSEMNNSRQLFDTNLEFTKIEDIKLGIQNAKSYYHSGLGYQQHIFVQSPDTKEILQFTISFASKSVQQKEQLEADQILSTFKFTSGNIVGKYCAGPQNLNCPSGYACKLNVIGKIESGGTCVNEAETNP